MKNKTYCGMCLYFYGQDEKGSGFCELNDGITYCTCKSCEFFKIIINEN